MIVRLACGALQGVDAFRVDLEADFLRKGMPAFVMVGLAEGAVREAKERVFAAMRSCGFTLPAARITVNLAPADRRKAGSAYDLPLAVALLGAAGVLPAERLEGWFLAGELSLSGAIKPVPGVLPLGMLARNEGAKGIVTAPENASEAALVKGLPAYGPATLDEAVRFLMGECELMPAEPPVSDDDPARGILDFADVKGQENVKRALEIAAAGGHNVLMVGPPGSGKSMLARRLPSILPDMTGQEAIEVTKVYSVLGMLDAKNPLIQTRPFRSPHHTISATALAGGGQTLRPGEISMAHRGVLFLDELPEFHRDTLEVLRQPLEDGVVSISRVQGSVRYPSQFMLVCAMNPCKCGWYGDPSGRCKCKQSDIDKYLGKVSGPLLDRVDIIVEVPAVKFEALSRNDTAEPSSEIKKRVDAAREIQNRRFAGTAVRCNALMDPAALRESCALDETCTALMKTAFERLQMSARSYDRIRKVARTIADLDGSADIQPQHIAEAISYRSFKFGPEDQN